MIFTVESKFELNDMVTVINSGLRFPTNEILAKELGLKRFIRREALRNKTKAVVVAMVLDRGMVMCGK